MKTVVVILFLAIGYLAIVNASPVPNRTEVKTEDAATSRQAAPAAPAVTADDDDDDDDDDDIGDLGALEEDDDDDDEETEDDDDEEEEDYLERFIDDLLGGEEDDDDDDDEKPSIVEPVQPASPAQTQATALPVSVQSDLNAESAAATNLAAESINDASDSTISYEDEDAAPEGQAVSSLEGAESAADPVILNQAAIPAPSQSIDTEDDDDEDDDDDIDLDLTEDDESDEEDGEYEEDDADEETDDLDEIADIADARRARAMEGEIAGDASAIYVAKYNRFVDNIIERINKILRANYDPVTVKLANSNGNTNKNKIKKKKLKTKSRVTSRDSNVAQSTTTSNLENHSTEATSRPEAVREQTSRASATLVKDNKRRATATKNKKKTPTKTSNKNKVKQTKPKPKSKAKATLYGLSSLKRSGNVSVNMMSDHTTIRTKFNLGPLILKVEKEFGRAAKKELRSATATTAEMSGKLSLRLLRGGAATLHSIQVLQPKQVRVDSPDDHDRTREFVWRRSSHIAHLVSQKLSSATRSMLRPPPITTVIA